MISNSRSKLVSFLISAMAVLSATAHSQEIEVALLDSGADPNRSFNLGEGFNYFLNISDTSDVSTRPGEGHGTVSTRLVSQSFSGTIVPFVVTDGTEERRFEDDVRVARDNSLSDILGRDDVRVVGITWGTEGVMDTASSLIGDLSRANKVVAIMAGNETRTQPNALSTSSFNLSGVIIVGGTDADGNFLPATNKAGTTRNKYVAAIGLSTLDATVGGSSFAAARISGIAGAVLQQNPDLTAAEVVDVILVSAEEQDLGEPGTDSEYGRGWIQNAEQVLNNVIGPVTVPTEPTPTPTSNGGGGGGGGGGGAVILIGGALAGALLLGRKSKDKLEKTLVLDSYGRGFQIDLSDQIHINEGSLHISDFFHTLDQTSVGESFLLPQLGTEIAFGATTNSNHRYDMIEYFGMPGDVVLQNNQADVSMAIRSQLTENIELTGGYLVSPGQAFGAASQLDSNREFGTSSFITGQTFTSVLSGFSMQGHTASLSYQPDKLDQTTLKLGLVSVDQTNRFGQDSFSAIFEGAYQFNDNAALSMQFGQIEERGSLFGGAVGGIFGVDTATTYALNVAGRVKTSDRYSIVANYGVGRTSIDSANKSLLEDFSSLKTDWYSIGMVGNDVFREKDQIGMAFSQPLKIRSGTVNYSVPTGREFNGDISFDSERIDLANTGATERTIEAYYRTKLNKKLELGSFIAYRQNPNHVLEQGDELLVMATLRYRQ